MTIEEKARAYDEAITKGRQIQNTPYTAHWDIIKEVVEYIIPELAESEDERVIRTLLFLCKDHDWLNGATKEECLNWLKKQEELDKMIIVSPEVWDNAISDAFENGKKEGEKQKEQKPAEWSKEDSNMLHDIEGYVTGTGSSSGITKEERSKWLWSLPKRFNLQPKQEWSKENEKIQQDIQYALRYAYFNNVIDKQKLEYTMSWLNSLRPSWKPSEEQMEALKCALNHYVDINILYNYEALCSLYEQLKKL